MVAPGSRPATVADVHALAMAMPHVRCATGPKLNPVYLSCAELGEVVQDAWLSRASARRAARWRQERELDTRRPATVRDDDGVDLKIFSQPVESGPSRPTRQ